MSDDGAGVDRGEIIDRGYGRYRKSQRVRIDLLHGHRQLIDMDCIRIDFDQTGSRPSGRIENQQWRMTSISDLRENRTEIMRCGCDGLLEARTLAVIPYRINTYRAD